MWTQITPSSTWSLNARPLTAHLHLMTMNRHSKILYYHHPAIRKSSLWQPQHSFPAALGRVPISLKSFLSSLPFLHGCWFKIGCDAWWTLHDVNNQNQPCLTVSGPERKERRENRPFRVLGTGLSVLTELKFRLPPCFPLNQLPLMWLKHFQGIRDSDWKPPLPLLFLASISDCFQYSHLFILGPGSGSVHLLNFVWACWTLSHNCTLVFSKWN